MLKRVLILGGTQHALELADVLLQDGRFNLIYSLAGRVAYPRAPQYETRIGGFGGVDGLVHYLRNYQIDALIDATHPFAAQISRNAVEASRQSGVPLIAFTRPPWLPVVGDRWHLVTDMAAAADLVAQRNGRVFLSIGRQEVGAFALCEKADFVIRSIEPPDEPLPLHYQLLLARGPFHVEDELELFKSRSIDLLVTKNSGGSATHAKIEAARALKIEVIMIERPVVSGQPQVTTIEEVLKRLAPPS